VNTSRQMTRTNDDAFFVEQIQNITIVADDKQLVDFLYKLGSGNSMTGARPGLQPDAPRQHLNGNIKLVASYQKTTSGRQNYAIRQFKPATAKAK